MKHQWLIDRLAAYSRLDAATGCVQWTGYKNNQGYGHVTWPKLTTERLTHRIAWQAYRGDVPSSLCVLHKCDNPSCINPGHLFLGTVQDNNADCASKGRLARQAGQLNGRAKLTLEQVNEIRRLGSVGGIRQRDLAQRFYVSQKVIWNVLNKKSWATT